LSSAEKCRRIWRRMSFTTRSAGAFTGDFFKEGWASSSFLRHYDEAPTLLNAQPRICPTGADRGQCWQAAEKGFRLALKYGPMFSSGPQGKYGCTGAMIGARGLFIRKLRSERTA
jgi:hypothetical protein